MQTMHQALQLCQSQYLTEFENFFQKISSGERILNISLQLGFDKVITISWWSTFWDTM